MSDKQTFTSSEVLSYCWLEIVNPQVPLRHVRHTLFDFDGTISVIRQGWEAIMTTIMIEML
jgi:hypothetical protein